MGHWIFGCVKRTAHLRGRFHMPCGGRCCRARLGHPRGGVGHNWRQKPVRLRGRHIGRREEVLLGLPVRAYGGCLLAWT